MKEKLKRNYKLIVAFIIGVIIASSTAYATATISSSDISYDNSTSGLTSTNMKGAIDELYEKTDIRKLGRFVSAYSYNQTDGADNYCVTGEEESCKKTNCYKDKTADSCKAGDIIKYKVNDTDIVTFHVMFDEGNTLTMQSQKDTIRDTLWISEADYEKAGGTDFGYGKNNKGPRTALTALENATSEWNNVNNQTYQMGTTSFMITKCDKNLNCTGNAYTLERTARARMITVQEATAVGCAYGKKSCPIWMYNYLYQSTISGGTVNDGSHFNNYAYWTMSIIFYEEYGSFDSLLVTSSTSIGQDCGLGCGEHGARAVVVINK